MLIYFVLVPVLIAVFLYLLPSFKVAKAIAVLIQGALLLAALRLFILAQEAPVIIYAGNYTSFLGIILQADQLASIFVILTVFVFLCVTVYSFNDKTNRLYWFLLFTLEGALIGLFLTRDLFNIFVLAEVTSVAATVFLMYDRNNRSVYDGMIYLMVNTVVMQFYLLGLAYIYMLTGFLDMGYATAALATLDRSQIALPYALVMVAIAAKCGVLPLFTFLPKVHSIPRAPVSVAAILSGLQVKSGLYLFLRFRDVFGGINMREFFLVIGIVTAVFGIVLALGQSDIRRMLAYSTIAHVGFIMVGLNLNTAYAHVGSVYYMVGHTVAKVALFLSAGVVIQSYKTGEVSEIRGVFRRMPIVGTAIALSILGITGAPFFSGNVSKYFMMDRSGILMYIVMTLISLGTIAVFVKFGAILFGKSAKEIKQGDPVKQVSVLLLGITCLAGGIFGVELINLLFGVSVSISTAGFIGRLPILLGSWAAGYLFVRYYARDNAGLRVIGRLDIGFRGICVSIGTLFALILTMVGFFAL